MLNCEGGDIFLGVEDSGDITGVMPERVDQIIKDLINLSNNPQKMNPPFIFTPKKYFIHNQWIIHIQLPADSQVHRVSNVVYFRNGDGDFKISDPLKIAEIVNKKNSRYTENAIFPYLHFEHFKQDLFPKIRNLIRSNNPDHPWLALDNHQLLKMAGLWKRDFQTGEEGYTLAAALLLGQDETIAQIVPHYKIDGIVRIHDISRYDDRLYIQTNLIEAYENLLEFVGKHLPDKFYTDDYGQRRSLRTSIFREVVANIIVHREYTSAYPCRFVIERDLVQTENANKPIGEGIVSVSAGDTFPKNPAIMKFFIQLGRAEELGSGIRNIVSRTKDYAGKRKPKFLEGSVFKVQIPIPRLQGEDVSEGVNEGVSEGVNEGVNDKSNGVVNGVASGLANPMSVYSTEEQMTLLIARETINQILDEEIGEGRIEGLQNISRAELIRIVAVVMDEDGLRSVEIARRIVRPQKTVERHINRAKALNLIRFLGPPKTGGYFTTEYFENRILIFKANR